MKVRDESGRDLAVEIAPIPRRSLAENVADRMEDLIRSGGYSAGDRLPSIAELARRFGVAGPTMREALQRLQVLQLVDVRHGSGVYALDPADGRSTERSRGIGVSTSAA